MKFITTLLPFLLLLLICSCDPGIALVISNKTATAKHIQVVYPANYVFPGDAKYSFGKRDSIISYHMNDKAMRPTALAVTRLNWDTIAKTYSFELQANYNATIESRFMAAQPTYGQVFIIDNTDTVVLKKKSKLFVKKPKLMLGGTWKYTIREKN